MKEYRVQLENKEIIGPFSENEITSKLALLNGNILVGLYPKGDWQTKEEFLKAQSDGFKEFVIDYSTDESTIGDATIIKDKKSFYDDEHTVINTDTFKYLEELKKQKKEAEDKKRKEELKKEESKEPDYENDATEVINIDLFKEELKESKLHEKELKKEENLELVKRRKEILEKVSLEEIHPVTLDVKEVNAPKKNKKIFYIVGALLVLFILFDSDDGDGKKKKVKFLNSEIVFPIKFDKPDSNKADQLYQEGLREFRRDNYKSLLKSTKYFLSSAENKFKNNPALARLIFNYSLLLNYKKATGKELNTLLKLVQIFKAEKLADPNFANAISYFYYTVGKKEAAVKIIDRFLQLEGNRPSAELFSTYLLVLTENGKLDKAEKISNRLLKETRKRFLTYRSLLIYFKKIGNTEKYITMLTEAIKEFPESLYFTFKKADLFVGSGELGELKPILAEVKKEKYGYSKLNYSKYLELKGLYLISLEHVDKGVQYLKKSLKLNESFELISRLAALDNTGDSSLDLIMQSKVRKKLYESNQYSMNGNSKKAMSLALEATTMAPNSLEARVHMAKLQMKHGYLEDAIKQLSSLYKEYRSSTEVMYALIDAYTISFKFSEAKKLLNIAASISDEYDSRYPSASAKYFLYKGNLSRASGWLQRAINANPLNDVNISEVANLYIKYYKFSKAKFYLKKAMELNPANIDYKISFAEILYEVESANAAITYLGNVLGEYPDDPKLLSRIGIYYYKSGQIKKYKQIKAKLMEVSRGGESLYRFLMESGIIEGTNKLIIDNGQKLLEIVPGDSDTRLYLAQLYIEEEKYKEAFKQLKEIKKRLSTYPKLQFLFAKLYLMNGDVKKAKDLAEREVKENPEVIDGYLLLGDIYKQKKDLGSAQKQYFKANQKDPRNIEAILGLAFVAFSYDEYDMALNQYQKAILIDPNRSELFRLLGNAYRKLGQGQLAVKNYKHFLELSPKSRYKRQIQTYIKTME